MSRFHWWRRCEEVKEYIVRYEDETMQLLPDKMQPLVRCKDCKRCVKRLPITAMSRDDAERYCKILRKEVDDDFFCKEGVAK